MLESASPRLSLSLPLIFITGSYSSCFGKCFSSFIFALLISSEASLNAAAMDSAISFSFPVSLCERISNTLFPRCTLAFRAVTAACCEYYHFKGGILDMVGRDARFQS